MAYIAITGETFTDKAGLVGKIDTALVAAGWTLFDDQSASSYRVYRTNGESGIRPYVYLKISYGTANVVVEACMFWNSASHTTTSALTNVASIVPTGGYSLWMYCSKNFFVIMTENSGTLIAAKAFGSYVLNSPDGAVKSTTTAAISAGTGVIIAVASTAGFVAGARYQISDPATGYRQTFTCTAVGATDITADTISTVGYASGSLVGTHTLDFICGSSTIKTSIALNHHRAQYNTNPAVAGTASCTYPSESALYLALSLPYIGTVSRRVLFPPVAYEASSNPSTYRYLGDLEDAGGYFYVLPPLNVNNGNDAATAASLDAVYFGQTDAGTTTGGNTVSTLNDTGKTWGTNAHAGKVVVCLGGTEVGQIRKIVSNTATQLVVAPDFKTIPISGGYAIADRGYRYVLDNNIGYLLREGV